jgi:ribosome-binding protein aMBF1 (putative translation factor)
MSDWNERVRDAMKRRGMTNLQLATELGVNQTTVGRWLSGRSTPAVVTIHRIGSILGIRLAETVITETGDAQETELLAAFRRMTAAERILLLHCLRDREHRCHNGPEDPPDG